MSRGDLHVVTMCLLLALGGCGAPPEEEPEPESVDEGPPGEVRLSPGAIEAAEITVGPVERVALTGRTVIPAEVRLDPTRTARVAPLVGGRIREVHAGLGDEVHAGDVLALMTSADAADLAAAIADTRARLSLAEAATARLGALGASGVTSQRTLLEAQADRDRAQAELAGLTRRRGVVGSRGGQEVAMVAPLDGLAQRRVDVDDAPVEPSQVLFTVASTTHVWVIGRAPERVIGDLREGAAAVFRADAYPTTSFDGTIALLSPTLDEETRTLDVRMELDDTTGRLRAGLFGSLAIGSEGASLVVPETAVARVHGSDVVFVPAGAAGAFRVVPVRVGHRSGGLAEILEGLSEDDTVVLTGSFTLKSILLSAELEGGDE
jgi:membrane fusion protein, heavy metal efflux system